MCTRKQGVLILLYLWFSRGQICVLYVRYWIIINVDFIISSIFNMNGGNKFIADLLDLNNKFAIHNTRYKFSNCHRKLFNVTY